MNAHCFYRVIVNLACGFCVKWWYKDTFDLVCSMILWNFIRSNNLTSNLLVTFFYWHLTTCSVTGVTFSLIFTFVTAGFQTIKDGIFYLLNYFKRIITIQKCSTSICLFPIEIIYTFFIGFSIKADFMHFSLTSNKQL